MSKDTQGLERRILTTIKRINRGIDMIVQIKIELMATRSRLCNLVAIYKENRTLDEVDDLFAAIVNDDALSKSDIKIAFDYDDNVYDLALRRIQERSKI
jgi:hypothetical protein